MGTPVSSGNRGVLALGAALLRLCLDAAPAAKPVLLGSHRKAQPVMMRPHGQSIAVPLVNWRLSPRAALNEHLCCIFAASMIYRISPRPIRRKLATAVPWIGTVERCAFVGDVRGGDSFSDIYGLKRFLIATLPVLSVILIKGSIVHFPQTYGPFRTTLGRRLASFILRRSSVIIARDERSQRAAEQLVGGSCPILLSPDVAFALHADAPGAFSTDPARTNAPKTAVIGVNINGLLYNGGYNRNNMFGLKLDYPAFIRELVVALLAQSEADILLVPHTYAPPGDPESDNDACRLVRNSLPPALAQRVRIVAGEHDAHQLKAIIGTCDFFVGSRMHSCIAALSQGVPCVGVAYSMKFAGVFATVGMEDWVIDGRETGNDAAIAGIIQRHQSRAIRRRSLAQAAEAARLQLRAIFGNLLQTAATTGMHASHV